MKSSNIHEGLDKKAIRDYLSVALVEGSANIEKHPIPYSQNDRNPFEWSIKHTENEIAYLQKYLRQQKQNSAICEIMIMQGWHDFDVDEITENDTGLPMHMNFIGTKEEFNSFIDKCEKEIDDTV